MSVILFTSSNIASKNIAHKLIWNHGFGKLETGDAEPPVWEREGVRLIDTKAPTVLDVPTDFDTDCIIVLSTHKSKTAGKMLTAHLPGNWGGAEMGGKPRTLNIAHAAMLKRLVTELEAQNTKQDLGWPVFLEADHHGPTCDVPILFVEIGNGEEQWADGKAAEVVAAAVADAIFARGTGNPEPETVFGCGGGHYSRGFTKLMLETDMAVGHIAPKYALEGLDESMFRQALERNVRRAAKVVLLKEEMNAAQKGKVKALADRAGIGVETI